VAWLEPDQIRSLTTGVYGQMRVASRSKLVLGPGTYYFQGIQLEPGATLELQNGSAPVKLYVQGDVTLRGTVVQQATASNELLIVTFSQNGAFIESALNCTLAAPHGKVSLAGGLLHRGAVFAKNIELHQGSTLERRPFAHPLTPDPIPNGPSGCAVKMPGSDTGLTGVATVVVGWLLSVLVLSRRRRPTN